EGLLEPIGPALGRAVAAALALGEAARGGQLAAERVEIVGFGGGVEEDQRQVGKAQLEAGLGDLLDVDRLGRAAEGRAVVAERRGGWRGQPRAGPAQADGVA